VSSLFFEIEYQSLFFWPRLASNCDPPIPICQVARITGMNLDAWLGILTIENEETYEAI
jgi:hypothetical protein